MIKKKICNLIFALLLQVAVIAPCMAASNPRNADSFPKNMKNNESACKMHEVFKSIVLGRYDVAGALMQDMERKMKSKDARTCREVAIEPLYDLGKALLLARPEGIGSTLQWGHDAWEAMMLVRNIYVRGEGIEEANAFLGDDEIQLSVDMIKRLVEKRLVQETRAENTVEAYERLMSVLDPHHPSYAQVKRRLAELEFKVMCTSAAGCRAYLRDYPDSPLIEQAKAHAMKYDFEQARESNTKQGWKRFISSYELVAGSKSYVAEARTRLRDIEDRELLCDSVSLRQLDNYASTTRRDVNSRIFMLYDNLINLPMHSYRYMSLKLNFGGVTGRVEELVKETGGHTFSNHFTFNSQGLLVREYDGRNKVLTEYSYGFDAKRGFYPLTKTVGNHVYSYICNYFPGNGHLKSVVCSDGTSMSYTYDEQGRLTQRVEKGRGGKTVAAFKSGKIRAEKSGRVLLKFLRYNDDRVTEIISENAKNQYKWNYSYQFDEQGRWTLVHVSLNGKPRMTITRSYGTR